VPHEYGCDAKQNAGSDIEDGTHILPAFQQLKILIGKSGKVVSLRRAVVTGTSIPDHPVALHGQTMEKPMRKHPEIFTEGAEGKGAKDPLTRYF